jgi:hypothetical protein
MVGHLRDLVPGEERASIRKTRLHDAGKSVEKPVDHVGGELLECLDESVQRGDMIRGQGQGRVE